jgi:hypothetical protein
MTFVSQRFSPTLSSSPEVTRLTAAAQPAGRSLNGARNPPGTENNQRSSFHPGSRLSFPETVCPVAAKSARLRPQTKAVFGGRSLF